jgi:hypothetical protein
MKVRIRMDHLEYVKNYMNGHSQFRKINYDTIFDVEQHDRVEPFYRINSGVFDGWELKKSDFYECEQYSFKHDIERILDI